MIGHNFTAAEIMERVKRFWDLSGPFPLPKWAVACPVCGFQDVLIKQCKFHVRAENKYRCDVMFKCATCSAVWQHGVKVSKEMALPGLRGGSRVIEHTEGRNYFWRDMLKILKEKG